MIRSDGTVELFHPIGRRLWGPVKTIKAGVYTIFGDDVSKRHNVHLVGVGVNRRTAVAGTGRFRWNVTLKRGKLSVYSDRARSLRYTVTVIP